MSDFIISYMTTCKFDNIAEKVKSSLEDKYRQLKGRIEVTTSAKKAILEVTYKGVLIFSKSMSMREHKFDDIYPKIETILEEEGSM